MEGHAALDGEDSPFAVATLQPIATPGVEIGKVFRLVRDDVMEATAGRPEPYVYGSVSGKDDFFLSRWRQFKARSSSNWSPSNQVPFRQASECVKPATSASLVFGFAQRNPRHVGKVGGAPVDDARDLRIFGKLSASFAPPAATR
jgi:hypothetical protein